MRGGRHARAASAGTRERPPLGSGGHGEVMAGNWHGGSNFRRSLQPGLDAASLRAEYQYHRPPLPGPPTLGEGASRTGFHPGRGVYGAHAKWDKTFSTKREPPEPVT